MVTRKKNSISLIRAKAAKTMTSPTRAAVTIFLAPSTALASPPEAIHLTPPIKRNIKEMIKATIISNLTMKVMAAATVKFGSWLPTSVGMSTTGWFVIAKAAKAHPAARSDGAAKASAVLIFLKSYLTSLSPAQKLPFKPQYKCTKAKSKIWRFFYP